MMYEDQGLVKISEDDPENWAIHSVQPAIDVDDEDEINALLADTDEDSPGNTTRTYGGMPRSVWDAKVAEGARAREASIEANEKAFAQEKLPLDIMSQAQAFKGKPKPYKCNLTVKTSDPLKTMIN
jgi:hypothetical protein